MAGVLAKSGRAHVKSLWSKRLRRFRRRSGAPRGVRSDTPSGDYRSALKRAIITLPTSSMAAETSLLQAAGSTVTW